jgi:endogenous inhibitor of DNA gyrase (YacG/DUF329 family)
MVLKSLPDCRGRRSEEAFQQRAARKAAMPRWIVRCPECKQTFTHTLIEPPLLEEAKRDPFRVIRRPDRDNRTCPHCGTKSVFESHQMFYVEDASTEI